MQINCEIDSTELILRLKSGQRRLAYAAVNAINKTAKRIQAAERERVEEEFTLRKPDFVKRQAAIIKPFASVGRQQPYAEISVGQKPRLFLSIYERGGERKPATIGAKRSAAPVVGGPARPTFLEQVPTEFQMAKLRFDRTKTGRRRVGVTRTSTYLIPSTGIFQRISPTATRIVYFFAAGQKLAKRLGFVDTAKREARRWFKEEMERETINAVARAKGRGL